MIKPLPNTQNFDLGSNPGVSSRGMISIFSQYSSKLKPFDDGLSKLMTIVPLRALPVQAVKTVIINKTAIFILSIVL
jgi:hypothetical protein